MKMTELLWQEHKTRVRSFIVRRVRDPDVADDILQDVFLKAHSNLHMIKSQGSITAWLYRVATNAIADYYRSLKPSEDLSDELPAPVQERNFIAELASCLQPLIADLPENYQSALVLSELEGLPQKEIAKRLGISLSGAKSRVQRGREKLRERLLRCCEIETGRVGIIGYELRNKNDTPCG